jgi:hypothetical protein
VPRPPNLPKFQCGRTYTHPSPSLCVSQPALISPLPSPLCPVSLPFDSFAAANREVLAVFPLISFPLGSERQRWGLVLGRYFFLSVAVCAWWMGCKGSKQALHEQGGGGGGLPRPQPPESWRYSGLEGRHYVAPRLSTLGTLSLDRAAAAAKVAGVPFAAGGGDAEATMKAGNDGGGAIGKLGRRGRSPGGTRGRRR